MKIDKTPERDSFDPSNDEDQMDKPISVGDLVYVKKGNACCGAWAGVIFRVSAFRTFTKVGRWKCQCGAGGPLTADIVTTALGHPKFTGGMPLTRLRRIPPPEELGIVDEREPVYAAD